MDNVFEEIKSIGIEHDIYRWKVTFIDVLDDLKEYFRIRKLKEKEQKMKDQEFIDWDWLCRCIGFY